jgi:hypothetical protein
MSIALGTLPDWFSGVGATGALVIASLAAKAAFGQVQHMRDQIAHAQEVEEKTRQRDRRSQASQVAVWIESVDGQLHVLFSNTSGLPIYHVSFTAKLGWSDERIYTEYSVLGPTVGPRRLAKVEKSLEGKFSGDLEKIVSGSDARGNPTEYVYKIRAGSELSKLGEMWADVAADYARIGIAFKDASETPWARHAYGELTEHGMPGAAVGALEDD